MEHKRLIAVSALAALIFSSAPQSTLSFSDVTVYTPYNSAISAMKDRGVIEGYADGTFQPENTINRAEFLKIVLEGRESADGYSGSDCFPDVTDEWFAKYVCTAKAEGIIEGYPDGTFKPGQEINFVEASKIISLAYEQDVQHGSDWYQGYVQALESSKAIPPSIDGLERQINRGEMTEMMWRLSEGRADQPSKSYMNVKYPEMQVDLSSDSPQYATSCADIQAFAAETSRGYGGGYGRMEIMEDAVAAPMMMRAQEGAAAQSVTADTAVDEKSYSDTNVQVEGVDEADIVKTDGTYLYLVRNQEITILRAHPADTMRIVSVIDLEDSSFSPQELYIDGDRMIVTGTSYKAFNPPPTVRPMGSMIAPDYWYPHQTSRTQVRIYDVSDRGDPELLRKVSFEGNKVSSRRIGDKLYLVMNKNLWWGGPVPLAEEADAEVILPKYEDSARDDDEHPVVRCADVVILPRVPHPQYLIVAVVPIDDARGEIHREAVVGNGTNVYMSLENLYVANTNWNYIWRARGSSSTEQTNVFRFAVKGDGIEMAAHGAVPGRILNQFSMDEHDDTFRIATTKGQVWNEDELSGNNLYILDMDLERLGEVEEIAPGESIKSVRFMGNRAYMVTFKQVDPLFVIDTEDPRNPKILGKLKIPGWSDYLHPYDENHLLGFGKEVDETIDADKVHSANAVYYTAVLGMKLAIFDVSDVQNPKEIYKEVIGDRGTESPLLHNHKALLFDKERNLLAFPISVMELPPGKTPKDTDAYPTQTFQGAYVYDVSLADGFDLRGTISHYSEDDLLKAGSYFYGQNIDRILRIEDSLLTIGQSAVQSHNADDVEKEGEVKFPESSNVHDHPIYWE